jgi:hypothetical protein
MILMCPSLVFRCISRQAPVYKYSSMHVDTWSPQGTACESEYWMQELVPYHNNTKYASEVVRKWSGVMGGVH